MFPQPEPPSPLVGLGMTSLVLGVISLLLFFMPILGIPISVIGLLFGIIGFFAALLGGRSRLRWSVQGICVCSMALLVNLAITYTPSGYTPDPGPPKLWQHPFDRPYVPPPSD